MLEKTRYLLALMHQIRKSNGLVKVHISYRGNDVDEFVRYSITDNKDCVKNKLPMLGVNSERLISIDIEKMKSIFLR